MKLALILLLALSLTASASPELGAYTHFKLSASQVQEFDETGWVTLSPEQKIELRRGTGIAPTRVRLIYDVPDGEVAELGYNLALKTSVDEIEVLHEYLMSDEDAARKYKQDVKMVTAMGVTTKDIPEFAIDSTGHLWKFVSMGEFQSYIGRNPKNIEIIYLHMPSGMPPINTVAAKDTLRQVCNYSTSKNISFSVIDKP